MKSLFWSKVQPKSLAGTVFMAMAQNEANSAKLDLFELENDFFDPAKEKSGGGGGEGGGGEAQTKAAAKPAGERAKQASFDEDSSDESLELSLELTHSTLLTLIFALARRSSEAHRSGRPETKSKCVHRAGEVQVQQRGIQKEDHQVSELSWGGCDRVCDRRVRGDY